MVKGGWDGADVTGSRDAATAYAAAIDQLVRFSPDVLGLADAALGHDPRCHMARALRAYLSLMSTEFEDVLRARALMEGRLGVTDLEEGHFAAIRAWCDGDWDGAARRLDAISDRHPKDVLALYVGHQLDFLLGDAINLRRRVSRRLGAFSEDHPHYGRLLGMRAFGEEECGLYGDAEVSAARALDLNEDDVWALHALAHVLEMQGRAAEGRALLDRRRTAWAGRNFLNAHTAWHDALFALEAGRQDTALKIYDASIQGREASGAAMELVDASGLLWRLHLDGVDVGGRWGPLAHAWAGKGSEPWYAFNDLHALMAFIGAGMLDRAEARVESLRSCARGATQGLTNVTMTVTAGLPAAEALLAYGRGEFDEVIAHLCPVRGHLTVFGGSHAQRDVFQRTLLVAALRAGDTSLARRLVEERLEARPQSAWTRARLAPIL